MTGEVRAEARWLNLAHAGEYWGGRSAEAVRMQIRRGRLGYVQDGRRVLVDRLEIDRLMEQSKVKQAV